MGNWQKSPGFWALALGAVGFCAGFFGPIALNPDANQGPLVGIFITGPGGALAGLVLGFLFRILPFSDLFRRQALMLSCTLLGAGTLWFVLPQPAVKARVVDATISGCKAASEVMPKRITHWEERIAAVTWAPARDNWREDTRRMLREYPGVVVALRIERSNSILEHHKPWNRGQLSAEGWKRVSETREYFAGGTCASYPRGLRVLLSPTGQGRGVWPPDDLPNFLGVQVLEAVPANFQRLVGRGAAPIS